MSKKKRKCFCNLCVYFEGLGQCANLPNLQYELQKKTVVNESNNFHYV